MIDDILCICGIYYISVGPRERGSPHLSHLWIVQPFETNDV